ncbi:phosphate-starvation-inducible PsiE family protein [Roseobacter litoralis]|uniref:phosphate-starvation-inducible PsiE family protein n=1 Tax=Roseobacter litoralis TaxID=42443 RepID=UPI0024956805|nr:phosphate-starvation-inducible PsiE family protein [Roseobacter litoralis]
MTDLSSDDEHETDPLLRAAHKFEYWVVITLVVILGMITLMAMARLIAGMYQTIFFTWDIYNFQAVQILFGMVMTVLIALEFGNSILRHLRDHSTIIQAREVILIGMMAVVRKVMIIDLSVASPLHLAALGAVAVSLASAFWFMRDA